MKITETDTSKLAQLLSDVRDARLKEYERLTALWNPPTAKQAKRLLQLKLAVEEVDRHYSRLQDFIQGC